MIELLSQLPFMDERRAELVISAFIPMLKAGFMYSIPLAIISFIFGLFIAILVALVRISPKKGAISKGLFFIVRFYVSAIRGTPILVQIMVVFYGLPAIGIFLDPLPTAIVAFSLNVGAYASESIRSAILSIPKGQWEAGFSIGMTYMQTFWRIIIPQASRTAIPPLSNIFISLFKETSLASVVTITELFRVAQQIANMSYDFLPVYIEAGLIYWAFCFVMFFAQDYIEARVSKHVAKP
ncbi:MAG: amino acid ABC transporter permease [Helicobacter sp.]|nr:amino acid ABC transporter permease [Helicobacter sp.]